ncbi:NUMOD3 domain-containing DNA-binding protein [Desulfosporosinus sp. FKB]|uniref:NUMOD3 domain-containing DNA-binding protein n=1 Tax=Desulfosporosinus sp. FKB TaxID=1969835 RepID=UPI00148327A5|nr:NUMOD3 domain-containing DNA-binding protein [Desulfosporosinus sp. FKB]
MKFINEGKYCNLLGIYKITQLSTGRIYIGQTKYRFIERYWHHVWKLKHNSHDNKYLQNVWNKYGENDFEFEVVHILKKDEDLNELEIMYIKTYDTYNNGFNLTIGGDGKRECPMSEEAKKIVGEKNRIHNLGRRHSEETKRKMRESSPHRKMTREHAKRILAIRTGFIYSEESRQKMRDAHIGSKNMVAVIDEEQASEIKKRLMQGQRIIDISNDMNVNYAIIRSIAKDKVWKHVYIDGWERFVAIYKNRKKK